MKFIKICFWNLFFLGIFGLTTFVFFEWKLRSQDTDFQRSVSAVGIPIFESDWLNTYKHKPGAQARNGYGDPVPRIEINNLGFRDEAYKNSEFQKNILMLGDSFTFGTGVDQDQTFTEIFETRLNQTFPDIKLSWKVWNAGHIGHSLDNYYLLAKKFEPQLKPELIIVNIFVANDITELRRKTWTESGDDLLSVQDQKIFVNQHGQLESWTSIKPKYLAWAELKKRWQIFLFKSGLAQKPKEPTLTWPVFLPPDHEHQDPHLGTYWKRFFIAWERFDRWSQRVNVPVLYNFIPMDVQVDSAYEKKYATLYFDEEARQADRPQKLMQKFCDDKNLNCLDFLPLFRANKSPERLYFGEIADPHFSLYGHQQVAEILLDKVTFKPQNKADE